MEQDKKLKNFIKTTLREFLNENKSSFFNVDGDDFVTKSNKEDDLEIRKLQPQKGYWVNFDSEYGDVWHKIIKTYEPDNYYASVYFYEQVDTKSDKVKQSFTFYHNIRKVSKQLPTNARVIFDETGAYSERRGNLSKYFNRG